MLWEMLLDLLVNYPSKYCFAFILIYVIFIYNDNDNMPYAFAWTFGANPASILGAF